MMVKITSILAVAFLVPLFLNIITNKTVKNSTPSLKKFCMKPPKEIAIIGVVLTLFIGSMTLLAVNNRQIDAIISFMAISLLALGILLMLLPVKGFWCITVDGDKIESSKLWVFRKTANIGEIER